MLSIVALLGCATAAPAPQVATVANQNTPSWCDQWNTYGDQDGSAAVTDNQRFMFHIGFFLTKSEKLAVAIKMDHPTFDEATMTKVMTCYEENTPTLVEQLDKVCTQAPAAQQDELVSKSLDTYISWCIKQSTTQA